MICNKCGCNNECKIDGKCSMAGKTCIDGLDKYLDEHNLEICSTEWLAEHDKQIKADLLDKVMQKWKTIIDEDGVMYKVVLLKDIEDLKKEVGE